MLTFCTLFNSLYLDKGLTLYDSLCEVTDDFILYILAMDDRCYNTLTSLGYKSIVPISLSEFENEDLQTVKGERSVGEYCWTCSSSLIKYVFEKFQPEYCTYIDADLYFYSDPNCIINEMKESNASVQVTGHRFYEDQKKYSHWKVGEFCVEFNTFKNDNKGRFLLDIWVKQCLNHCSIDGDGVYWGDQKYLDNWVKDYDFVIETQNLGAGVAPWNIAKYRQQTKGNYINLLCENECCKLVFYHFENITYYDRTTINMNVFGRKGIQQELVLNLYSNYLRHVDRNKALLKAKFDFDCLILKHPGEDTSFSAFYIKKIKNIIKDIIYPCGKGNYITIKEKEKLDIIRI